MAPAYLKQRVATGLLSTGDLDGRATGIRHRRRCRGRCATDAGRDDARRGYALLTDPQHLRDNSPTENVVAMYEAAERIWQVLGCGGEGDDGE